MIYKKSILFLFILYALNIYIQAKKLTDLPRLTEYFHITIGDKYIYISDGKAYTIRIYLRKDYQYIKSFGKQGEGPGEFITYPNTVYIRGKELISFNKKEMHFTLEGKLIREKRLPFKFLKPVLNNYITEEMDINNKKLTKFGNPHMLINIYNNKFERIKTIYNIIEKNVIKRGIYECFWYRQNFNVIDDKIVISDPTKGFYFKIFDSNGSFLYEINIPYKKIYITDTYRTNELMEMKKDFGKHWNRFKKSTNFIWPKYLPTYMDANIFDNKICVFKYTDKGYMLELIIIDLKGKVLGKALIPRESQKMCTLKDGIYYYIYEGDEDWELHSIKIF